MRVTKMKKLKMTEQEKEERKQHIIDVSEKIFFKKSFHDTSMAEIAEKAGVAKGTLYLYFPSKKQLYYAVVFRGMHRIETIIMKNVKQCRTGYEKVVSMGRSYVEFFFRFPDYYNLIVNYESHEVTSLKPEPHIWEVYQYSEELYKHLVRWIQEGLNDGSIRQDLEPQKLGMVLWAQTTGLIQQVQLRKKLFKKWSQTVEPKDILHYYLEVTQKMLTPQS